MTRRFLLGFSIAMITITAAVHAQTPIPEPNLPIPPIATQPENRLRGQFIGDTAGRDASPQNRLARLDRDLTRDTRTYVSALARSTDSQKDTEIMKQLENTVKKHFLVKQQIRQDQLVELENRAKRLREIHDRREAIKLRIIEKRVLQLTDEAKGLGWSDSPTPKRR